MARSLQQARPEHLKVLLDDAPVLGIVATLAEYNFFGLIKGRANQQCQEQATEGPRPMQPSDAMDQHTPDERV